MSSETLRAEWFPAYGIRLRELPHLVILGKDYEDALGNLSRFKFYERRDRNKDYTVVFTNEPFEIE